MGVHDTETCTICANMVRHVLLSRRIESRSQNPEVIITNPLLLSIASSVTGPSVDVQALATEVKSARRKKEGGSRVTGTRVKLEAIVTKFKRARGKKD